MKYIELQTAQNAAKFLQSVYNSENTGRIVDWVNSLSTDDAVPVPSDMKSEILIAKELAKKATQRAVLDKLWKWLDQGAPSWEFEVQGLYSGLWEVLFTSNSFANARDEKNRYVSEDPGQYRIKRKRCFNL